MKREYLNQVIETLKEEVPALRWIDADEGQLDFYTDDRPPVAFPCCLVELSMTDAPFAPCCKWLSTTAPA